MDTIQTEKYLWHMETSKYVNCPDCLLLVCLAFILKRNKENIYVNSQLLVSSESLENSPVRPEQRFWNYFLESRVGNYCGSVVVCLFCFFHVCIEISKDYTLSFN